ncbi:MAG: energy transducer TonB [Flavobacteriaceae bacterium]|nr:energy transducer TonB [Flavobacteriaceae bacterium]
MLKPLIFLLFFCQTLYFYSQDKSKNDESVAFAMIDDVPVYPGCEKLDKNLQKMCFQNQLTHHIRDNYNTRLADSVGLEPGKTRVYIQFRISKEGIVDNIRARAPHSRLEEEGIRVMKLLPKMQPGMLKGKPVAVKYVLPLTLLVQTAKKDK